MSRWVGLGTAALERIRSVGDYVYIATEASTSEIQAAIDTAGAKAIVFAKTAYTVGDTSLKPKSGQTLILYGTTLTKTVANPGGTIDKTQALFDFEDVSDVTILGGTIKRGNDKQWGARFVDGSDGIKFIGTRFENISVWIQRGNSDISFLGCTWDLAAGTGNTCISTGGTIDLATGSLTGAAGYIDGLTIKGCTIIGGGNEAIDINWATKNIVIVGNRFVNNGTAGSGDEVIDIGGSSAQSATVAAGGSGYVVGNVIEVNGGTVITTGGAARRARFRVDAVSGGAVTAVSLDGSTYVDGYYAGGHYMVFPGETGLATTAITGSGTGATLNVEWGFCSDAVVSDNVFQLNTDFEQPVARLKWETRRVSFSGNKAYFPTLPVSGHDAVKIENCYDISVTDNSWENIGNGVFIEGPCDAITVSGNTMRGLLGLGVTTGSITSDPDVTGLICTNNQILAQTASVGAMISLGNTDGALVSDNRIVMAAGNANSDGISIAADSENARITDNIIFGGLYGILAAAGADRLTITGNETETTHAEGIRLEGQNDHSTVSGNKIKDAGNNGTAWALTVVDADWSGICNNKIWDVALGLNIGTGGSWNTVRENMVDASTTAYNALSLLENSVVKDNLPEHGAGYGNFVLADDTAIAIPLNATTYRLVFSTTTKSTPTLIGGIWVRCTGSPDIQLNLAAATNVTATTTTVLTGTTGIDGNITVSAANGILYIENRAGSSRTFAMEALAHY